MRTGILRVFGADLRNILARSVSNRFTAALSGIGVTALLQSSTATALIVSAFVGQGLMALPSALAVMLGADIGTSLMALVFSRDLSWLSPLFILIAGLLFISLTGLVSGWVGKCLPLAPQSARSGRPSHLDPTALATPSLAITCAVRESLHQADVVETMMLGMLTVIKNNDRRLAEELREMDDVVDELYSAIKYYLTKISREALGENESRRWTDIISFTINMEQVGDIIERVLVDIEDKKINLGREFSEAGMAEICELHARLVDRQP